MSSCPGEEMLILLATDAFGEATYAAIEEHVEACPRCTAALERLSHRNYHPSAVFGGEEHLPQIPGFRIRSKLGGGAMGVVYLANETGLDRLVALKILPGGLGPDVGPCPRRRWLREARAVSSLRHPNVVPLYDYGEADGRFFLVLEYVPGGTLKQRLVEPLPPRIAARLTATIARAVGYVHGRGLLHLDLKPSNILLDCEKNARWDQVNPKVSDFGLALSQSDAGPSETSLAGPRGTPSYMAPEQTAASSAGVGPAADIHAIGAILYELLSGRPPFQGSSALETLDQVRGQRPVPPRRLNPKIPRDLETIAIKCLERHPSRRYASAEALADDLHQFLEGRPIKARPVSPIEHAGRWCRRQPAIAALAVTLFLTVTGSLLGLSGLLLRSETLRSRSEANYQVATRSLDEITRILSDELMNDPLKHEGPNSKKTLEIAHAQQIQLAKRYPLDIGGVKRLATITVLLAHFYSRDGKRDPARSLIQEAIGHCDAYLSVRPGDADLQHRLFELVACMLSDLASSENGRLYEQCNARAIALLERLKSVPNVHVADLSQLSSCHRRRADHLMSGGQSDRARKELEEDLALVRSVPVAEIMFPEIVSSKALTLGALARNMETELANLTARRIGWLPSAKTPPTLIPEDISPEAWADRLMTSLRSDAAKLGLDQIRIPPICWFMLRYEVGAAEWQRQHDKLGDARRSADRLLALAERLVQSYPEQAPAYVLLSEGYLQRAKIAYRADNEPVIGWERKSLDAAVHAATLDPENDEARSLVRDRRARLRKIAAK